VTTSPPSTHTLRRDGLDALETWNVVGFSSTTPWVGGAVSVAIAAVRMSGGDGGVVMSVDR
jgi:hypothetical protein